MEGASFARSRPIKKRLWEKRGVMPGTIQSESHKTP